MFEFELAQENRQLFKNEIKKNLVKKMKPYCQFTEIDIFLVKEHINNFIRNLVLMSFRMRMEI